MSHKHLVEFYESDSTLIECVASFVVPALDVDEAVIIVATPEHRHGFETSIRESGVDIDKAFREGRYLVFDASETLTKFMVDGRPDPKLFEQGVGALITSVLRAAPAVRIYGEMVAILWEEGNQGAAIELEDLWNDLADVHPFELLCAYPLRLFDLGKRSSPFWKVCNQHTGSRLTLASSQYCDDAPATARDELSSVRTVIERALRQRMIADELIGAGPTTEDGLIYQLRSPA